MIRGVQDVSVNCAHGRNEVDTAGPWTIKVISTATRNTVTAAARREGLTVGQRLAGPAGPGLARRGFRRPPTLVR